MAESPQTPRPPRTRSQTKSEARAPTSAEDTPRPSRQPAPPVQAGGSKPGRRPYPLPSLRTERSESPTRNTNKSPHDIPQNLKTSFPSPDLAPIPRPLDPTIIYNAPTADSPKIPLIDFLRIPPPEISRIYETGKLTSTRAIPKVKTLDLALEGGERLLCVVPVADMMLPLIAHVEKEYGGVELDPKLVTDRDWILSAHPALTSTFLPSLIHSESDTEDWVLNVLWRPALAAYSAVKHKTFARMGKLPNLTSCSGGGLAASLPDVMVWDSERALKATVEVKTHAAFVDSSISNSDEGQTFQHVLGVWEGVPPGHGIRYVWAESDKETGTTKADRMIAQVWLQMVKHKMRIAALTNYNSVIFFVKEGQTLYMSGEYTRREDISLAVFAFLCYAFGLIPMDTLILPTEKKEWWRKYHPAGTAETPGLDHTTLPRKLFEYLEREAK